VADRKAAGIELGEQRLDVCAGGSRWWNSATWPIATWPAGARSPRAGEGIADEAHPTLGMEPPAVEGDDAGGFLAAMLQAWSPRAVIAAASRWPKMPNTPHSSRSRIVIEVGMGKAGLLVQGLAHPSFGGIVSPIWPCCCDSAGAPRSDRLAGGASCGSCSSPLGRFSRFKMVLSGSSGNIDISHCPVPCSPPRLCALTHSAGLRSGTSQTKNRKATTTIAGAGETEQISARRESQQHGQIGETMPPKEG